MAWAASPNTVRLIRFRPRMSATELIITMSLSPTNARTSPEASVLSITLGTPSGRRRMAAVPIEVPARPPDAEHTGHPALGMMFGDQAGRPGGRGRHGFTPIAATADGGERRSRRGKHGVPRNVRLHRRLADAAGVDQARFDAERFQSPANELRFVPLRIQRGQEINLGHGWVPAMRQECAYRATGRPPGRQGRQPNASYRSVEVVRSRWSLDLVEKLTIFDITSTVGRSPRR